MNICTVPNIILHELTWCRVRGCAVTSLAILRKFFVHATAQKTQQRLSMLDFILPPTIDFFHFSIRPSRTMTR